MATVHPSRLGLVPQERPKPPLSREEELRRKLLERKGSGDNSRSKESRDDDNRRSRYRDDEKPSRVRSPSPRRERDRSPRRERGHDVPPRLSDDRPRSRERYDERERRPSPTYRPYDGPPRDGVSNGRVPDVADYGYGGRGDLPQQRSGAPPPWRGADGPNLGRGGYRGGGGPGRGVYAGMDLEKRRAEREQNPLSIWPPSPKQPYKDEDEMAADRKAAKARSKSKKSKSKKSKRRSKKYSDSDDTDDSTDSEEERRRRRKRKEKERRKHKYSDDESEEEKLRKKRKSHSESRARSVSKASDDEDQWIEKDGKVALVTHEAEVTKAQPSKVSAFVPPQIEVESDEEVGPNLPTEMVGRDGKIDRVAFANMLPGEGEAMAAYAASGQRIPRRGEIGLDSETIEKFEESGYVMSGSRHRRMNAVRMRKENQVINAEEQRAILKLQREEKEKKEGMIIAQFRDMMEDNLKRQGIQKQ